MRILTNAFMAATVTAVLTTGAMASENQKMLTLGASYNSSDLVKDSSAGGVIGIKYRLITDSSIVFGTNFDFNYFSGNDSDGQSMSNMDFGGDIVLGYKFDNVKTSVYGIVGYALQALGNDQRLSNGETGTMGYGFSYGGGVDWEFANDWHVIGEYKKYSMSLEGVVDYDYKRAQVSIGYDFD